MMISNAFMFVAAAKIRADEDEKKKKSPPPPGEGLSTLPDIPLLSGPPTATFQPGAAVRDVLSGMSGIVVQGPPGDFGSIVFVKFDADQQTHPMSSDQLEAMPAPVPILAPPAAAPAPAPEAAPEPATAENKPAEAPKGGAKAALRASAVMSDPGDPRAITYGAVSAKARPVISASKLLAEFGYVPLAWDRMIASLSAEGVTVLRSRAGVDVRAMLDKGYAPAEIVLDACAAGGPVRASTIRQILAVRANIAAAAKAGGNGGAPAARPFRAGLTAGKPTMPMPTTPPGPGMMYAWNDDAKQWYETTVAAKLQAGLKRPAKNSKVRKQADALYKRLIDEKFFESAYKKFPKSNDMGSDTDNAVVWLREQVLPDDASDELTEELSEMIYAGLT